MQYPKSREQLRNIQDLINTIIVASQSGGSIEYAFDLNVDTLALSGVEETLQELVDSIDNELTDS